MRISKEKKINYLNTQFLTRDSKMSKISKEKKEKIMSNIMAIIYENFPKQLFTAEISKIEARDEEFIKRLLFELKEKGLLVPIRKSAKGKIFSRRIKWRLSNNAYEVYKTHQQI